MDNALSWSPTSSATFVNLEARPASSPGWVRRGTITTSVTEHLFGYQGPAGGWRPRTALLRR